MRRVLLRSESSIVSLHFLCLGMCSLLRLLEPVLLPRARLCLVTWSYLFECFTILQTVRGCLTLSLDDRFWNGFDNRYRLAHYFLSSALCLLLCFSLDASQESSSDNVSKCLVSQGIKPQLSLAVDCSARAIQSLVPSLTTRARIRAVISNAAVPTAALSLPAVKYRVSLTTMNISLRLPALP